MTKPFHPMRKLIGHLVLALLVALLPLGAMAQDRPTLGLWGMTGLIDMPSGESLPDGFLSFSHSRFGPISRNTLTFQITPRLSGSFRYLEIRHFNDRFCPPDCAGGNAFQKYYDRNFDLRYQVLKESKYFPAVTIGLQDFVGTGLSAAEYIVATKNVGHGIKVTAGLGFGRLGSYRPIAAPLGPRPNIDFGAGGNVNFGPFFRGNVAPFGGIEWQINDKWGLKAEYSSDAYREESKIRRTFVHSSPFNFGVEYQASRSLRLGAYYMYGTTLGFAANLVIDPGQRPMGGMGGPGPEPVLPRPTRAASPAAYATLWVTQSDAKQILIDNITNNLARTGIIVEQLGYTADTVQIRIRNVEYDAGAQAIGRVARALSQTMPASVETFEIIPVVNGMPAAKITLKRTDLEALEFAPDAGTALRARTTIANPGPPIAGLALNAKAYPKFTWAIAPYANTRYFDPSNPFQIAVGARLSAAYEPSPGVVLSGSVTKLVTAPLKQGNAGGKERGPHIRTDSYLYDANADPDLETLTAAWYGRLSDAVYARVTVGYLERMFGGISTEVLWRPVQRRWALGAELDYVAQRNFDGGLGFDFYDYKVALGHVSGYFDLGRGMHLQLDVGRYLAGDVGATLTLTREFANGWKVGAFATKTNLSARQFGEGSFDKGIMLQIPLAWLTNRPTRALNPFVLRPLTRNGGAQLQVNGRLYDTLHGYDAAGLDAQWGRVWK